MNGRLPLLRLLALPAIALILLLPACLDGGFVSLGGPLRLTLTVDQPTVDLGRSHVFRLEAQGQQLLGLILEYGDGHSDSIPTAGAQTASHAQAHIFEEPGTYLVRARAEDGSGQVARDSVTVTVRPLP